VTATADGSTVQVAVSDAGAGVPAEFVAQLFDRFTRGESTSGTLGTGLGLFILRRLADANGGTVTYRPNIPHGSVFVIHLEVATPPPPPTDGDDPSAVRADPSANGTRTQAGRTAIDHPRPDRIAEPARPRMPPPTDGSGQVTPLATHRTDEWNS
jgi:hypothetical protein